MKTQSFTRTFFLQLICSVFLCLSAYAQTTMVNLHFLYLPEDVNTEPMDLMLGEKETIKVEMPTNSVSKSYQVAALDTWTLGKATVEKGKYHFETYGEIKSIKAENQLIIVSRKSEEDGGGLVMIPIDYSQEVYAGGMYYFVNLTDTDIEGTIGKSEFSIEPEKFALVAPEPDEVKGAHKYCFTKISYKKEELMQPFISSTWRFSENARSLVFFYYVPKTKMIKIHSVRSYIQ